MSTSLKEQIRLLVWKLMQEHYNLDKKDPHVLTAKKLMASPTPIDQIADSLTAVIAQIIDQLEAKDPPKETTEEASTTPLSPSVDMDDDTDRYDDDGAFWMHSGRE